MYQLKKEILIEGLNGSPCYDFTYDGEFYYITANGNYIYKVNTDGTVKETIHTRRRYYTLVYDKQEKCFWAASYFNRDMVYRMSADCREINYIQIRPQNMQPALISRLLYCESDNIYAIRNDFSLCLLERSGHCRAVPLTRDPKFPICFAYIEEDIKLYASETNNQTTIHVETAASEASPNILSLPSDIQFKSLLTHDQNLSILGTKEHQSVILLYEFENPTQDAIIPSLGTDILQDIPDFPELQGQRLNPSDCNNHCDSHSDTCSRNSCCDNNCDCNCDNSCSYTKCCHCACLEILETIACQEASLAHILNAEGEKIQLAVKNGKCIDDLLKINESVQNTIIHASHLELVLYSKLQCALSGCKAGTKCTCGGCKEPCRPIC